MLLYRVFFHRSGARAGTSGHATYLYMPQLKGRWDNAELYRGWYLSTSPEGAVGETFGNVPVWSSDMFMVPTGFRRALATFSAPDDLPLFALDDAANLLRIGMRPSQVVTRNTPYTQSVAARLFAERTTNNDQRWAGLTWWSYHRPTWSNTFLWDTEGAPAPLLLESVDVLTVDTPAVRDAAAALSRPLPPRAKKQPTQLSD